MWVENLRFFFVYKNEKQNWNVTSRIVEKHWIENISNNIELRNFLIFSLKARTYNFPKGKLFPRFVSTVVLFLCACIFFRLRFQLISGLEYIKTVTCFTLKKIVGFLFLVKWKSFSQVWMWFISSMLIKISVARYF